MKQIILSILFCIAIIDVNAQVIPEGTYCIKYAQNPSFCMDLSENGRITNGQNILLWQYWAGNGQKWIVTHERGGIVIRSYNNQSYVVDLQNGKAVNDCNIQLYQYNSSASQRWYPEYVNGHYILHNAVNQNICLDLYCGNVANGTNIQVYQDTRQWPQRWIFEKIDGTSTAGNNNGGNVPQVHTTICPGCGGSGTLAWRNYITCKTCGGTGILATYQ